MVALCFLKDYLSTISCFDCIHSTKQIKFARNFCTVPRGFRRLLFARINGLQTTGIQIVRKTVLPGSGDYSLDVSGRLHTENSGGGQ